MKIRIYETDYNDYKTYCTDWTDVTEEQYKLLSKWFLVETLQDLGYYLNLAAERQEREDKKQERYRETQEKKKAAAEKAARAKKEKLLAKLKQELEGESNS